MPIDEKEEFDEESQISLWETDRRSSNVVSTSMQKHTQRNKCTNPLVDEESDAGKMLVERTHSSSEGKKPEALVTNPILEAEPGRSKRRSSNRVLEEVHTGLMSKFHQEREDGAYFHSSNPALKNSHAAKPRKNKGRANARR